MSFSYPLVEGIQPNMHGFFRIDHDAYHQGLGVSSTKVKKALVSRATFLQEDSFDSPALAFGRAFHAALLEPELFAERYVVEPEIPGNKNSNAYKAAYADWLETVGDREILAWDADDDIQMMVQAVKEHPEYRNLPKFDAEVMAITPCPETSLLIKCKADLFGTAIVDFKTTSGGLSPADVTNDMVKWRYHVSAAFYQDIVAKVCGERLPFIMVPVTKKAPHECEFYRLSDDVLEEGRKLYKAGLRRILYWLDKGAQPEEKKLRVLGLSSRVLYATKDVLEFVEG